MSAWYAIQVRPVWEKRVLAALEEMRTEANGLDCYLPLEIVMRGSHHGRQYHHARPLLPGYVFALLTDDMLAAIHDIEGANRVISFDGRPAPIPAMFVGLMRLAEQAGEFDKTKAPTPKAIKAVVGRRVRIARGPYEGRIGVIVKLKPNRRLRLLLEVAKGATWHVDVEQDQLTEESEQVAA